MTYNLRILNSHPVCSDHPDRFRADNMAMKLVGERHEKRELVDLVRWLILDKAETANGDLYPK